MSLLFSMLSRLVITFLPRNKCLLISWLQSPSPVILEPRKIKSATVSIVSPSICHEVMGPDAMILVFWMLSFKPTFLLSSFTFIKRLFSSSLSAIMVVSSAYLRLLIFLLAIRDLEGQLRGHSLELGTQLYGGSCPTEKVQVGAWKTRQQLHLPLSLQSPAGAPIAQTQPEARRQG